ncbi:MAG: metal-dependent hydrolase [Moraxellaceae bacterium]|nr:metal-dependent hydrolase [Moraxellaceae bacterium]
MATSARTLRTVSPVAAAIATPDHVSIKPQRMNLQFSSDTPRYWFDNDPVVTHFLNAMSLSFPDGERFFVDSVRQFRDRVEDPKRQKDISGFIGQEAMHSLEHTSFNRFLDTKGYAKLTKQAEKTARLLLKGAYIRFTTHEQLAATAALEHLTAILADALLRDDKTMASIHPGARALWMWHAIEETEHKAVAFDLYQDVDGRHAQRKFMLIAGTVFLAAYTGVFTWKFLKQDGMHKRPLVLARGLWKLFGRDGLVTRIVPDYLDFFRDDFHPWMHENSALIAKWRRQLDDIHEAQAA